MHQPAGPAPTDTRRTASASTKPSTAHLLALAEHLGISIVDQLAGTAHPERGHPTTEPPAPTDQPATDQDPR